MGSRLAVLAQQLIAATVLAWATPARADDPEQASVLMKQGIEQFKTKNYAAAAATLDKAYALDARADILFALAQAKRLNGECKAATKLYRELLDRSPDMQIAKLIRENLTLCEHDDPSNAQPAAKPPEPRLVVIEHPAQRAVAVTSTTLGAIALGIGAGYFLASRESADNANHAIDSDEYAKLKALDTTQQHLAIGFAAGGAVAAAIGISLWVHSKPTTTPELAITPSSGGVQVWLHGRW